ncbi:MAG: hypothetical protein U0670_11280 [Anaerolineae bacterium]
MRRGTIVLLLFLAVIAAVLGLSQFLRTQPPLDLQIAVSPMAQDWIAAALERYNATNPVMNTQRVRFVAVPVEDLDVWGTTNSSAGWSVQTHPAAWIPAWSASVSYVGSLPFRVVSPSLAKTVLVWGAFTSRVDAITGSTSVTPIVAPMVQPTAPPAAESTADATAEATAQPIAEASTSVQTPPILDWDQIAAAAAQVSWRAINPQAQGVVGNFTMAYNRPTTRISGLAVLLSGSLAFHQTSAVSGRDLADQGFRSWLQPVLESVPNFATLGASPAMTLASRGASIGDIALLPENDWLKNLSGQLSSSRDPIQLIYPQYTFVFDFPMAVWSGAPAEGSLYTQAQFEAAMNALAVYLNSAAEQASAQSFGLRPADGSMPEGALFTAGAAFGMLPALDLPTQSGQPLLSDMQRLLTWANNYIR